MISVFISYARADGTEAAMLVEDELKPPDFKVWRDVRNLDPFNDFSVEIERAIVASDLIVVLVTPSIEQREDSFVRREILYAQAKNKRILPIRINNATIPILIIHLTWIDAVDPRNLRLGPEIKQRLALPAVASPSDQTRLVPFVRDLIDDILLYLEQTTLVLLGIAATGLAPAVGRKGALPSTIRILRKTQQQAQTFTSGALGQTAVEKQQRIILHGSAGSGKTTSLFVAARQACYAFLEDPQRRLPIFCRAADWKAAEDEPILNWLERSAPTLPPADLRASIDAGRVALFVDGLDELGPQVARPVSRQWVMVDPRRDLLAKLPVNASLLVATRSDALDDIGEPQGFTILEMEPLTDAQISDYLAGVPKLAELVQDDPSMGGLLQTPLMLGLLGFVAKSIEIEVEDRPVVGELSARSRVVDEFVAARWQHEKNRGTELATLSELLGFLGRIATRHGTVFNDKDVPDAVDGDPEAVSTLLNSAMQVEFVRTSGQREFAFFHPCFMEYYATVHCRRYLGDESSDGYDDRLFTRIAQLGDRSFIPQLVALSGDSFWRGEYGDQIAATLDAISRPDDEAVVETLLNLAGDSGTGWLGVSAIGNFARRSTDEVKAKFITRLSERTIGPEEVHQLISLGEPGIEAVARAHEQLDESDPMRRQIESYVIVRRRLGLN